MKLVAAVSGGVDSAVAAARAKAAGHDVTGVHMILSRPPLDPAAAERGCLAPDSQADARRVADALGLPFEVWDFTEQFQRLVVAYFLEEYQAGRTPNPCLRCNETIKFAALLDAALGRGFDGLVTGHYARLATGADGVVELHRASDQAKDQSYVLSVLNQGQLRRAHFPLGDSLKPAVRQEAAGLGLPVAAKTDSYDLCFIPDGDTAGYLRATLGDAPGAIVDNNGTVLGHHRGTFAYTIGQRRGLRLGQPANGGEPRYVTALHPERAEVEVGPHSALRVDHIQAIRPSWTETAPAGPISGTVQLRAHAREVPARLTPGDPVQIELDQPTYGIAPGQMAVFYQGSRVIGSATIELTS